MRRWGAWHGVWLGEDVKNHLLKRDPQTNKFQRRIDVHRGLE